MLAGEDLVAGFHDQPEAFVVEPLACVVGGRRGFLERGIGRDHLPRDEIFADAEVFERTLGLSAPELISWNLNLTKAISFFPRRRHVLVPSDFAAA
jgi:hypothetical protein